MQFQATMAVVARIRHPERRPRRASGGIRQRHRGGLTHSIVCQATHKTDALVRPIKLHRTRRGDLKADLQMIDLLLKEASQ